MCYELVELVYRSYDYMTGQLDEEGHDGDIYKTVETFMFNEKPKKKKVFVILVCLFLYKIKGPFKNLRVGQEATAAVEKVKMFYS